MRLRTTSSATTNEESHGSLIPASLEEKIHRLREAWKVPGLAVTVVASPKYTHCSQRPDSGRSSAGDGEDGKDEQWQVEYLSSGIRAISGDKVTPDTIWSIASNSKFFVPLSIGLLIHDGLTLPSGEKLSWTTKVKEAIGWELMDKYAEENLTLRDLLCELCILVSSAPIFPMTYSAPHSPSEARTDTQRCYLACRAMIGQPMLEEMIGHIKHFRPSAGPREIWQYNNYAYSIATQLFPRLANIEYVDFVQQRIFDPLGMTATFNYSAAEATGRLSESFMRKGGSLEACKKFLDMDERAERGELAQEGVGREIGSVGCWSSGHTRPGLAGMGGILMNARDMSIWLREVLDPKVIPAEVLHQVIAGQAVESQYPDYPEIGLYTYCLGQEAYSYRGHQIYQHSGSAPGQASWFLRVPDKGVGVFAISNDDSMGAFFGLVVACMILDYLLDMPPIDWAAQYLEETVRDAHKKLSNESIPPSPRPMPPGDIAGRYWNPGYRHLHIRPWSNIDDDTRLLNGRSKDNVYVAEFQRYFYTHITFTHLDGRVWQWRMTGEFPQLHPDGSVEKKQFSYGCKHGTCVFNEAGLGFFGNVWGQGGSLPISKPDEEHTEEKAEIWFARESGV